MKSLLLFLCITLTTSVGLAQDKKIQVPITNLGQKFELIGELGVKLGETVTVEGIIVAGPHKFHETGPNLLVQMINNKSIQQKIQIPIIAYFGAFGDKESTYIHLPQLDHGATYRFRVYETGQILGVPVDAYREAKIPLSTSGFFSFRNQLIVISGQKVNQIQWSPADFVGRDALLSGIAKNENESAIIQNPKWKLVLKGATKWSASEIGKLAEVHGAIHETDGKNIFRVENCRSRLVNLKDQLGKTVKLRGTAHSAHGHWWFNYRGTDMYVENMKELPNWSRDNQWRPIEITGTLEQAELPSIDEIWESDHGTKLYYIVRNPKWTPVDHLLTPELDPRDLRLLAN
ncbi:MAG: hypothetical protein COA78_22565 [Blastopirellula sp.]|nr:MAG: hypothetical protein COA78_22565 [Blastopirellula sp.]